MDGSRKFYRSTTDRKVAGVCGGIAHYFNMDPTLVRVLWVVLTLFSFGAGFIGYLLLWLLAPEDNALAPPIAAAVTPAAPAPAPAAAAAPVAKAKTSAAAKPKAKAKAKPKA